MRKKFKPEWQETDIPTRIKIELWRLMKDNPQYGSWSRAVGLSDKISDEDKKSLAISPKTYQRLKRELDRMPAYAVRELPKDLQDWIVDLRPDLAEQLELGDTRERMAREQVAKHYEELVSVAVKLRGLIQFTKSSTSGMPHEPGEEAKDILGYHPEYGYPDDDEGGRVLIAPHTIALPDHDRLMGKYHCSWFFEHLEAGPLGKDYARWRGMARQMGEKCEALVAIIDAAASDAVACLEPLLDNAIPSLAPEINRA